MYVEKWRSCGKRGSSSCGYGWISLDSYLPSPSYGSGFGVAIQWALARAKTNPMGFYSGVSEVSDMVSREDMSKM